MKQRMNKTKLLIWLIIILIAVSLATIISGIVFSSRARSTENLNTEIPFNQRADFLQEQLGLSPEQRDYFMEYNREFNQEARVITNEMNDLRFKMIREMAESNPDKPALDEICSDIGTLHSQLKEATVSYYLKMKSICDKQQQEQLNLLFERMLDPDGIIYGRGRGGQGRGRQFNQTGPGQGRGVNREFR
jgi:uncharacterized membrane protein